MKITAETLSRDYLLHLREECCRRKLSAERCVCADVTMALAGSRVALDRCVTHWHEIFSEDIDALDMREKAAVICQVMASNHHLTTEHQAAYHLGLDGDSALHLSTLAIWDADAVELDDDWPEVYARAEALIRTEFRQKEDR